MSRYETRGSTLISIQPMKQRCSGVTDQDQQQGRDRDETARRLHDIQFHKPIAQHVAE